MTRKANITTETATSDAAKDAGARDQSIGHKAHQRKVTKADLDRTVAAIKVLGLVPTAVEVSPGKVRFVLSADDAAADEADNELAEFRKQHGYG